MQSAPSTLTQKWLTWVPRVLVMLFAAFLLLFSFDVFEGEATPLQRIGGFLMHNIPVFLILIGLWLAWKHPLWGCVWFAAIGVASIFAFRTYEIWMKFLLVSFPMFVIAALYGWKYYVTRSAKDAS